MNIIKLNVLKQIAWGVAMYSLLHKLQFDNIHISHYLYLYTNTRAIFLTGDTKVKPCDQTYFSLRVGLGTRLVLDLTFYDTQNYILVLCVSSLYLQMKNANIIKTSNIRALKVIWLADIFHLAKFVNSA